MIIPLYSVSETDFTVDVIYLDEHIGVSEIEIIGSNFIIDWHVDLTLRPSSVFVNEIYIKELQGNIEYEYEANGTITNAEIVITNHDFKNQWVVELDIEDYSAIRIDHLEIDFEHKKIIIS